MTEIEKQDEKRVVQFLRALNRATKKYGVSFSAGLDEIRLYDESRVAHLELAEVVLFDEQTQTYSAYIGFRQVQ